MSEEAIGTVGEHTATNDDPGIALTDLVDTPTDTVSNSNRNIHGDSGAVEDWFYSSQDGSEVMGKGDMPEWFNNKTFKSVEEQAKAYPELRKLYNNKLKGMSGAPEDGYQYEMPEEYAAKDWKYNTEDPGYQDFLHVARDNGLSQELVNEFTDMLVENTNRQQELTETRRQESMDNEINRLSVGDTDKFEAAIKMAASNPDVNREDLNVLLDNLNNAESIKAFTSLMNQHNYSLVPGPDVAIAPSVVDQQDALRQRLGNLDKLRGHAREKEKQRLYRDYEAVNPGDRSFG